MKFGIRGRHVSEKTSTGRAVLLLWTKCN